MLSGATNALRRIEKLLTHNTSVYKLKLTLKLINMGQNNASYIGPKIWNNLTNECKLEENLNKFKHKIKDTFFTNIQRADDDIYIYY